MLVESGRLARLGPRHLSLSGSFSPPSAALAEAEREAVRQLTHDQVDVVLLVPT
jgi:hypothetical protein